MVTDKAPVTDVFHAVSDATRRALLDRLRNGDKAVQELAGGFDMSRPAISKHLRVLREADLVRETRQGRNRVYRLNPKPLREADEWIAQYRQFWQRNLASLKKHVEER